MAEFVLRDSIILVAAASVPSQNASSDSHASCEVLSLRPWYGAIVAMRSEAMLISGLTKTSIAPVIINRFKSIMKREVLRSKIRLLERKCSGDFGHNTTDCSRNAGTDKTCQGRASIALWSLMVASGTVKVKARLSHDLFER